MYKRSIDLSAAKQTFFLWGPRQSGKSSLLKATFPKAYYVDLLLSDLFVKYSTAPNRLREEIVQFQKMGQFHQWIIIDEIEKVPQLLNEVHWMIENMNLKFGLCGSSARKVRRGHANLLGGRALRFELFGMTASELGAHFDLKRALNHGYLPRIYDLDNARDSLRAYVTDYLKEEIAEEGLVRNLPQFSRFLEVAALSDTEQLNYATIARETEVSAPAVKSYFEILEDTFVGSCLEAYRHRPKRRIVTTPKFYFYDVGVVNALARRGEIEFGSELAGKAFENWVYHELKAYQAYRDREMEIGYWRLASKIEVDFIVGKMDVAIEAKSSAKITSDHLKGLRELKIEHPKVRRRVIVCLEASSRQTEEGIEILSYQDFIALLWGGKLV